jgi:coniferyl-aldehyde dehydrogenase
MTSSAEAAAPSPPAAPAGSAGGLGALFAAQQAAFARHRPSVGERLDALRRLERALIAREPEIVAAVSADFGGRATEETLGLELYPLLSEIRCACRNLRRWTAPRRAAVPWPFWPARAQVLHEALGVVGIVSSWNYPVFLNLAPLAAALAAGNHALLKPSPLAPAAAELLASIVRDVYPSDYVTVISGGEDVAAEFLRLPFNHLLFTGSPRVGKIVLRAASENLVPVTLELGGKSPAIVHPTYSIRRAAGRILNGKLYNAGQTCIAPDYVLVHSTQRDGFVQEASAAVARMYPRLVGNPDYTRIINAPHYRRLSHLVDDARRRGAEFVEINREAETCDSVNRVFPPTLLANVRDDMAIMQEEIFGPVLPIVEYDTIEEAVEYVNARPHPLAL